MWSDVFSRTFLKRLPRALVLAILLSLLVHLVILGSEYWHLPSLDTASEAQQVTLQAAPVADLPPAPKPRKRAEKKPEPAAEAVKPALPLEQTAPATSEPEIAEPEAQAADTSEESAAQQEPVPETLPEEVMSGVVEDEVVGHEVPAFNFIDTEFVVLRGESGNKVGITRISYRMQESGRYSLTSTTEAKGLAALVVSGKLLQQSEGMVTSHGLQPEFFSYQYGKGESKKQQSQFDWAQHKVTLETAKSAKTVELPEGTQDLLSFMYQFIFVPPLEQVTLHISNGKKLGEYNYGFEGEETLNTEFGAVRAWHIVRAAEDGEKTELWLAVDYHYLPVKMRKTEEDGSVIEQLATRISTDLLK